MGSILNFVFAEKNISKIFKEGHVNGHENSEKFFPSSLFNWLRERLDSISITTDYQIKKNTTNIFLIECRDYLRDFFKFNFTDELKRLIRAKQVKVVVGSISEPTSRLDKFEIEVENFCKKNYIPIDSLIFIDSNKLIEKCKKINWYYVPHFIYDSAYTMTEIMSDSTTKNDLNYVSTIPTDTEARGKLDREYYFISLTRVAWKKHRVLLGCYFIEKNDDRILWSFIKKPTHLHWYSKLSENNKKLYSNNIDKLKEMAPKFVIQREIELSNGYSDETLSNFDTIKTYDKDTALSCYFDIVSESAFANTDNVFFTEKIMKPLINLHPFIVIATGGFLRGLRSLGFKTYDGLFDESYDDIVDKWERFDFITREIDRILSKSKEEIKDLYEEYLDVCIYNRNHLLKNFALGNERQWDNVFREIPNE